MSLPSVSLIFYFKKIVLDDRTTLALTIAPETQIVDVARANAKSKDIRIIGRVKEKLAVKQELASEKASAIRLQSQLAEKERLSRKYIIRLCIRLFTLFRTMTIDQPSKNGKSFVFLASLINCS